MQVEPQITRVNEAAQVERLLQKFAVQLNPNCYFVVAGQDNAISQVCLVGLVAMDLEQTYDSALTEVLRSEVAFGEDIYGAMKQVGVSEEQIAYYQGLDDGFSNLQQWDTEVDSTPLALVYALGVEDGRMMRQLWQDDEI